jgi:serine/threonine-protein kinase RsbW
MTIPLTWTQQLPPTIPQVVWSREIPSSLELKQEIMDALTAEMLQRGCISDEDQHWLCLCLDEALVNAILHGNEGDETMPVRIQLGVDGDRWILRIDDQGQGFVPDDDVPDPEDSDSLLLEHGRGIRLMREWLDELTYYRGGASLVMARRRTIG